MYNLNILGTEACNQMSRPFNGEWSITVSPTLIDFYCYLTSYFQILETSNYKHLSPRFSGSKTWAQIRGYFWVKDSFEVAEKPGLWFHLRSLKRKKIGNNLLPDSLM